MPLEPTPLRGRSASISESTIHGSNAVGWGTILLFVGLGLLVFVLQPSLSVSIPRPLVVLLVAFFPLGGASLIRHGLKGQAREKRIAARRTLYPNQPWRWDHLWDPSGTGDVTGEEARRAIGFGVAAGIFLIPFNWILFTERLNGVWLLVTGFFDLAVLAAFARGIFLLLRRAKYRDVRLRFASCPFVLGRDLVVDLQGGPRDFERLTATLRCVEEAYERSGRSQTVVCYQLWATEQTVPRGRGGSPLRFTFRLPDGDYETRLRDCPPRYWELEVAAETPGIDFRPRFLLPVYAP